jgi:hypothetical protein
MNGPTPRGLLDFVTRRLRLRPYLQDPGDGRPQAQIAAQDLLWSLILGTVLRQLAFLAIEALVGSKARRNLRVGRRFGDDALGYFTARLDPGPTRAALAAVLRRAKRNKAFEDGHFVGLALDGTTGGRRRKKGCPLCRPYRNAQKEIAGYRHPLVLAAVVGSDLVLPVDVEPYGPGDSEYAAGQRLLRRVRTNLGARFIDYVVVDGEFATAPFLHVADEMGWPVVARLKGNLPELSQAVEKRFALRPPDLEFREGHDHVQIWDDDDLDPWEGLEWDTVRVIRYRQQHPNGEVVEADWLTNLPSRQISRRCLYSMAKSRWQIENEGFNDAKNRYGLEHIRHHQERSLLMVWLLTCLSLTLERLFRLRYLHRGVHRVRTAINLFRLLLFGLSLPVVIDST